VRCAPACRPKAVVGSRGERSAQEESLQLTEPRLGGQALQHVRPHGSPMPCTGLSLTRHRMGNLELASWCTLRREEPALSVRSDTSREKLHLRRAWRTLLCLTHVGHCAATHVSHGGLAGIGVHCN